jgi:hypothetical protein
LLEFIMLSEMGFWTVIALASILMMALVQYLHERFALILLVGIIVYLKLVGMVDVVVFARHNPWTAAGIIVGYLTLGAASLWPLWYGFVADFIEDEDDNVRKGYSTSDWKVPKLHEYKDTVISWIFLWPWNMLWFIIRHPIRRIGRAIFNAVEFKLNALGKRMEERAKARWEARSRA